MTDPQAGVQDDAPPPATLRRWGAKGTAIVLGLIAVVLVVIGATVGLAIGNGSSSDDTLVRPAADSVDVGFAQDMIVHHEQGVLMAHYAELDTESDEIRTMAYDINYTQTAQLGQMQGWLALWDRPQVSDRPHMAWMGMADESGHGGHDMGGMTGSTTATGNAEPTAAGDDDTPLMPGMATSAEVAKLASLRGVESDIYFLQLMIRHHQGGAPMMAYAEQHATNPVVRNFAGKMLVSQTGEIQVMTQMLAELGAEPLTYTPPAMPTS